MKTIRVISKKIIEKIPLGHFFLKFYRLTKTNYERRNFEKKLFTYYYKTNFWGCSESLSGSGSTLEDTEKFRVQLSEFLHYCPVISQTAQDF